jgi:hypothetical protein
VEVLARIYKYRQGAGEGKKRETFLVSHTGNGRKDSRWWSPTLSFIMESWGNT